MAMLREQGEFALARGDRAGAEAAWSEMLKLVVEPTDRRVKKPDAEARQDRPCPHRLRPRDLDGSVARAAYFLSGSTASPRAATVPGQPRAKAARAASRSSGVAAIELAALDSGSVRASDADRAVGRRARLAGPEPARRA